MYQAFHNNQAMRNAALLRLAAHAAARRLVAGNIKWSETECSQVACIIDNDALASDLAATGPGTLPVT